MRLASDQGDFVQFPKTPTSQMITETAVQQDTHKPIVTNGRAEVTFKAASSAAHASANSSLSPFLPPASLDHLYYRDPMKILFPRPMARDLAMAVLVTTSGGMVGGDQLALSGRVRAGASAIFTAQAAEKVYRSEGPDCQMQVDLAVEDQGWLEWLPQDTILFNQARLRRQTQISVEGTGRVLAGEIMVFGRLARGEVFETGLARDGWDVRIDGRPIWRDALHLEGDILRILDHPAAFDGARANATAVFVAKDARDYLELARQCLDQACQDLGKGDVLCAASAMDGIVIIRFIAQNPMKLRHVYGVWWKHFRHEIQKLPAQLPRLWEI